MIRQVDNVDLDFIQDLPVIERNRRKKASRNYVNIVTAFDIESSRLKDIEQSFMYIWQMQIGPDLTVTGRTWDEYFTLLDKIGLLLPEDTWMVIYVHSLSYEFSFLKGWYEFTSDEVFCPDPRKVLKCEMYGKFEYRCSYFLTNMSLDRFLKKYSVENLKTELDYSKVRYPWTPLTASEMEYCVNDVKGLVQALTRMMETDGDDLGSVPLTSTGYVRRDIKKAMQQYNHVQMYAMQPDPDVYTLLREAFRGGDTLSNRWNTDEILEDVRSVDIVSSYPASMLMNRFPMSRFYRENVGDFDQLIRDGRRALLFRVTFVNIRADMFEGHLYLSRDKCRDIYRPTFANGRIVRADLLDTTLTDVDFRIVSRRYKWDRMVVSELWSAKYRMLPHMFRDVIKQYYRVKTELKGVTPDDENYYFYMNNKAKLNSLYGMSCEDPARDLVEYVDREFIMKDISLKDQLEEHARTAFTSYAWGVWTTAWSRLRLADGIDVVTKNGSEPSNFIYSDTDSIKYIGDADFTEYNERVEDEAVRWGAAAADRNGEMHFMGVYEPEPEYGDGTRFKTLGAKKYVMEDAAGFLHITIAGVNKKRGASELGSIDNFREGFIFRKAGGTESLFNDNVHLDLRIEGHDLPIRDNVVIRNSTYTLGIAAEYRAILDGIATIKYSDEDIDGLYRVKR